MTQKNNTSTKSLFSGEVVEILRSKIHPANYNPRTISEDGRRALKKSLKQFGVLGGIIVNKRTGYTIVGGHQKVDILDEINKYDKSTKENDYTLRIELIDVDQKTEKEINISLNNPKIGGEWDADALASLIKDIDYKNAGLTEEDLNLIGCDFLLQTEEESNIADELDSVMAPLNEVKEQEKQASKEARMAERADKIAHMKDVKESVKKSSNENADEMDAYIMLSFDSFKAKASFCERFGYDGGQKFIKGEVFEEQIDEMI